MGSKAFKFVRVSLETWKVLVSMKTEQNAKNLDVVIKGLIKDAADKKA